MRRPTFAAIMILALCTVSARANAQSFPTPHLRSDAMFDPVVRDAVRWSSIVRGLIERLDRSDLTVYVRMHAGASPYFYGHLAFLSRTSCQRYVVIELPPNRNRFEQIGMLGHELQHAVEIAEAPDIVDVPTLISHYERIGIRRTNSSNHAMSFETDAAAASGRDVWREAVETAKHAADAY
jgi:hypothetical protein